MQCAMPRESKIVSGSIAAFVAQYMPFMNDKDALVNAVTKKLKKGKGRWLDEEGWVSMKDNPGLNEDEVFAKVAQIAETVYRKAVECDPTLKEQRTTILDGWSDTPNEHRDFPQRQSIFYGDVDEVKRDVSDAVFFAQFAPKRNLDSIAENEDKIVRSSAFVLFDDPCRRFTLGFTIEDYSLRLWYFGRGHIAISESVDFHEDPHHFVRFLLFVTFAPREALGYDSTIQRVKKIDDQGTEEISYLYKVGEDWYETIGEPLYEGRWLDIVSSAPRIWKVKKVLKVNGDKRELAVDLNVLKDYWPHNNAKPESQIQDDIFDRLRQLDVRNGNETRHEQDARPYFITILADESVLLEGGTRDETPSRLDNFRPFTFTKTEADATPAWVRAAVRDEDCQPRVHQRIVFQELCRSLYSLRDLQTYVQCLALVTKGLFLLRLAHFVHRDISPGNCLYFEGRVIITDLEHSECYEDVSMHNPRTGTAEFMAVEAQREQYIFLGRPKERHVLQVEWFKNHYLHDLESVVWMFVWFISHRIPVSLLPKLSDGSLVNKLCRRSRELFVCTTTQGTSRRDILLQNTHASLIWNPLDELYTVDAPFGFLITTLYNLLNSLADWYTAIESSTPLSIDGSLRWSDDVFKTEYHEKVSSAFTEIAERLGPTEVHLLREYIDNLLAGKMNEDGDDGKSRAKCERDTENDGAAEKEAEAGSKRSKTDSEKEQRIEHPT